MDMRSLAGGWSCIVTLAVLAPMSLRSAEPDEVVREAEGLLEKGQAAEARKLLEPAAAANPKAPRIQFALAKAAILEKDFPRARKHLEKAVDLEPGNSPVRMVLASIYRREKKPKDAAKQLEAVLKADPKNSGALIGMGELEGDAKRHDKAAGWYEKALALRPNDLRLASLVATAWTESVKALRDGLKKQRDAQGDKALAAWRRVLELKPEFDDIHFNLGTILILLERYDEAVKCLKTFIEKRPEDGHGLFNLAQALEKDGKGKEALEVWHRFLALAEEDKELKADIPQAKEHIKKLEKNPKGSEADKKDPKETKSRKEKKEQPPKVGL